MVGLIAVCTRILAFEEMPLITAEEAVAGYQELFLYIRRFNPSVCAVFLNFPMNLKNKPYLSDRAEAFEAASQRLWTAPRMGVVDLQDLAMRDLLRPKTPTISASGVTYSTRTRLLV